jgi:PAS domain-containing protein
MRVGVLLQGPRAEILLSNPAALELLGLTEDQLLGKTSFDPEWKSDS